MLEGLQGEESERLLGEKLAEKDAKLADLEQKLEIETRKLAEKDARFSEMIHHFDAIDSFQKSSKLECLKIIETNSETY